MFVPWELLSTQTVVISKGLTSTDSERIENSMQPCWYERALSWSQSLLLSFLQLFDIVSMNRLFFVVAVLGRLFRIMTSARGLQELTYRVFDSVFPRTHH